MIPQVKVMKAMVIQMASAIRKTKLWSVLSKQIFLLFGSGKRSQNKKYFSKVFLHENETKRNKTIIKLNL